MLYWVTENGMRRYLPTHESFVLNGVQYLSGFLAQTKEADLRKLGIKTAPPAPPIMSVDELCLMVDSIRDRKTEEDLLYDFGDIMAADDFGNIVRAGPRYLQMKAPDRSNWTTLQGAALTAVISGNPSMIMPMRVEDNYNVLTSAAQVLGVLAHVTEQKSKILFYGGSLKQHIRVADKPNEINITDGWPE